MTTDHIIGAVAAYAGAFTAQMVVNRRLRRFVKEHLDGIYRRLGRVETMLTITPEPFPQTDLSGEQVTGAFRNGRG